MDLKWFHEMSWSDWDFFAEKDSTTLKDSTKDSTKFFAEKDTIPVLWWARMGGKESVEVQIEGIFEAVAAKSGANDSAGGP